MLPTRIEGAVERGGVVGERPRPPRSPKRVPAATDCPLYHRGRSPPVPQRLSGSRGRARKPVPGYEYPPKNSEPSARWRPSRISGVSAREIRVVDESASKANRSPLKTLRRRRAFIPFPGSPSGLQTFLEAIINRGRLPGLSRLVVSRPQLRVVLWFQVRPHRAEGYFTPARPRRAEGDRPEHRGTRHRLRRTRTQERGEDTRVLHVREVRRVVQRPQIPRVSRYGNDVLIHALSFNGLDRRPNTARTSTSYPEQNGCHFKYRCVKHLQMKKFTQRSPGG